MIDKQQFIEELGLQRFTPEEQDAIFDDFTLELGSAISDGLTDEQMAEFTAIINGDQPTIDSWFAAHEPDFRTAPVYQELEVGYREDPEKVPADKVYASIGWIRVNRPDFAQIVERIKREFAHQLSTDPS